MITLNLLPEEAQFIFTVLGQLPTQTNAFPLFNKVGAQLKEQQTTSSTEVNVEKD